MRQRRIAILHQIPMPLPGSKEVRKSSELSASGGFLSATSQQLSALSIQLEAQGENQIPNPHLPKFPAFGEERFLGNSFQRSAVSDQLEAKGENQIPNPHLTKFPASGGFLGNSFQRSAVSDQLEAKGENQTPNPHLPKFPAFGEFLLTRPKGTKSRRSARGRTYAQRELPHWMHQSRCPASQGRTSILSAVRNHALCSGYPLEINRVINLRRLPECEERLAVILQKSGKAAISPPAISYQPSAFSLKHKAKTRFQIPISPNSLPPARSG